MTTPMLRPPRAPLHLLRHPAGWIASGFGAGYSPVVPGTVGSLVALPLFVALATLGPAAVWIAIVIGFALGVWASGWVIGRIGAEDPGVVVIDEWVGQWLTLAILAHAVALLPNLHRPSTLALLVLGFVLFRVCDIVKPWPACWADTHLTGGLGAMTDDALAAIWAGAFGVGALFVIGG